MISDLMRVSVRVCVFVSNTDNSPSFASGLEFLMNAENLAKMSIPAVFDSGCLAPSLMYLHPRTHNQVNTHLYVHMRRLKCSFDNIYINENSSI